jgi:Fur family transcriptional regulator, ferric uptake regulator
MTLAPKRDPLTFDSIDEVTDALRRAGHRVTTPTRTVLDALFASDRPISAEQIAEGLDGRLPTLELTSVYRNLERLEQLGVVSHVHVTHGPGLYALARDGDREYLVCERCGRVTTVEPAELDPIRDTVHDKFGYDVRFSHFPLHGHCRECAKALEREGS